MALDFIQTLKKRAGECFERALKAATDMKLSANFSECRKYARAHGTRFLADEPVAEDIEPFHGMTGYGAVLAFDLRGSTRRALAVGDRNTFITMHVFIPVMLSIVEKFNGIVVGLRGDGAITCFNLHLTPVTPDNVVPNETITRSVGSACSCGYYAGSKYAL